MILVLGNIHLYVHSFPVANAFIQSALQVKQNLNWPLTPLHNQPTSRMKSTVSLGL